MYYLEDPYGHLMNETVGNAQGRTHVRCSFSSLNMPWVDTERCCRQACQAGKTPRREKLQQYQDELGLPHSEDILALLVSVHISGGAKDLSAHLSGLTMRGPCNPRAHNYIEKKLLSRV